MYVYIHICTCNMYIYICSWRESNVIASYNYLKFIKYTKFMKCMI